MGLVVTLLASLDSVGEGGVLEINVSIMPRDRLTAKSDNAHARQLAL